MKQIVSVKRENLHRQNGHSSVLKVSEIVAHQRQRIRAEAMAAYEKAKANKIPGRLNWPAMINKYRKRMEEFSRQRHGGGMEPLSHGKT
ncbi:MAG: hypothetical protein ABI042_07950 [Verrucomicrobiota bacterium]